MALTPPADAIARAEALGLQARAIVEGLRLGDHRSPNRGYSVEFVQHREYVPGDDLRHIDWKVYGRQERYIIKQYQQETNFIGRLVVDVSRSMLYGDGALNKLAYAKLLAASLAHVIIQQGDACSLDLFDDAWRQRIPPSSQPAQIRTILLALELVEPVAKTSMATLLEELAESTRRRSLFFLISDCFDQPASLLRALQHLRVRRHEVSLLHILHPEEVDFPFEGHIRFDGLEDNSQFLTRPELLRSAYKRAMRKFQTELRQGAEAQKVDYVECLTSQPLAQLLGSWLARRTRLKRM
ncbi:MAG TPA: DUF58 domain-containing protein [Gemmatales bacterium]|nr:DUF58 domain-containing protein [Gemmatales bacterium]